MPPLVSVLMTAYNHEQYIAEAIESVLAQTFTDFELIIVDDGSKDSTVEIARRYTNDRRVCVHVNEKNLGDYPNRNRAAELATGNYLKYVDGDDIIYPHGLQVMVRCMAGWPEAAQGLSQQFDCVRPQPFVLSPRESYQCQFLGGGFFGNAPTSAIIRAQAFRSVGGFSGGPYLGDTELWLELGARFPTVSLPAGLVWWRSHAGQQIRREMEDVSNLSRRFLLDIIAVSAPNCPLAAKEMHEALRRLKLRHARVILRLFASGRWKGACRVVSGSKMSWPSLRWAFAREVTDLSDQTA